MTDVISKPLFERIIELFVSHHVEFIVIGGRAEMLMGSARITLDTDICYRRTKENLERLARALKELNPTLRGAPSDLPFRLDAQSLALGGHFTFSTIAGELVVLGEGQPIGEEDDLFKNAGTDCWSRYDVRLS